GHHERWRRETLRSSPTACAGLSRPAPLCRLATTLPDPANVATVANRWGRWDIPAAGPASVLPCARPTISRHGTPDWTPTDAHAGPFVSGAGEINPRSWTTACRSASWQQSTTTHASRISPHLDAEPIYQTSSRSFDSLRSLRMTTQP